MGFGVYLVLFALGAGAVALWLDFRFPDWTPRNVRGAIVRLAASFVIAHVVVPTAFGLVAPIDVRPLKVLAIFAVAFVAVTYSLLAAIWMIKLAQARMRGSLR